MPKSMTFTGANFTGFCGEKIIFCLLKDGTACPPTLCGTVRKIYRAGRNIAVDVEITDKHCTHTYFAKDMYRCRM